MDALFQEYPNSMNRFMFDHGSVSSLSNRNLFNHGYDSNIVNETFDNPSPPFDSFDPKPPNDLASASASSSSSSSNSDGSSASSSVTLKFISDVLMEEDFEGKTCMLQDCLGLQAAEKSFYDVLGQEYPHSSSNQINSCSDANVESPDDGFNWSNSIDSSNSFTSVHNNLVEDSSWVFDQGDLGVSQVKTSPVFEVFSKGIGEGSNSFSDSDSLILAPKGNSLKPRDKESDSSPDSSRGRKNHQRDGSDDLEEERRNKHSAFSLAESEQQSDLFDRVLLCPTPKNDPASCSVHENSQNGAIGNEQRRGSKGRTTRSKKKGSKGEVVDLSSLLTQCAQAVAIGDRRTATEQLQQIKQHSSQFGDADQRLAHYFADALDARLAGTKTPAYSPIVSNRTSAAEILKAYQVYIRACPFKRMSNFFANRTILKQAEKSTRLHIIDFGILYGFQWPCLIQRLSERTGGPPKLRITGIELPQPGFRPAERVEETGRRLKRYCERFDVPFEYNVIAQKWETINYEDLKIDGDEMTVVNCLYRLWYLPDDTIAANSVRDTVLKLINRIKPDVFIQGVVNGTFNAPFFVTRFREALFHFSSLFDMFEANVSREDEHRMLFEREIWGKDIMNVIACEGTARVARPETYRQWQSRNMRAGFRQLPLNQEIFKNVKSMVKSEYDKDFIVDEDSRWMLQGWKGRIVYALSVWKPVQ